ncbi:energy transducer TonB [Roseococcus sp. SDR]|uniref:energy transducer TonB n=1 Tax=Roseococcus sp. SDR TaxID=2835532 RepID=UPI001BCC2F20|nr:energy transducer TonB [Roseococcus sp. SDR]MBS7789628.1 energy transducer TonB [Roseococcus sp. SDR]MBV1844942.1 energy transducer TonB [Roseococcus sp. SDR]
MRAARPERLPGGAAGASLALHLGAGLWLALGAMPGGPPGREVLREVPVVFAMLAPAAPGEAEEPPGLPELEAPSLAPAPAAADPEPERVTETPAGPIAPAQPVAEAAPLPEPPSLAEAAPAPIPEPAPVAEAPPAPLALAEAAPEPFPEPEALAEPAPVAEPRNLAAPPPPPSPEPPRRAEAPLPRPQPPAAPRPRRAPPTQSAGRGAPLEAATLAGQATAIPVAAAAPHPGPPPLITQARYRHPPTPPAYPPRAISLRMAGTALIRALVGPDGQTREVRLHRSSGFGELDNAALAAVRGWAFAAATEGGRPIEAWVEVPVRFRLDD